jgi:outer membrane biosynthesis protein TonB
MSKSKIRLSLSLDPENGAQMLALANFALTLVEAKTGTIPEKTVVPVTRDEKTVVVLDKDGSVFKDGFDVVPTVTDYPEEQPQPEEPKKRKRRTKAGIEAESNAETEQAETAEMEPAETESESAEEEAEERDEPKASRPSKITLDDVRRAVAEKKEAHLPIMKFKLKEEFGVKTTPELAEHQYEAFYNFVTSLP